jgi:hypothetical protein
VGLLQYSTSERMEGKIPTSPPPETQFKLLDVWKIDTIDLHVEEAKRQALIKQACVVSDKPFPPKMCTEPMEMLWWEEAIVCSVCLIFFGSLLYGPFIFAGVCYYNIKLATGIAAFLAAVVVFPKDIFVRSSCFSYVATLILRYFSYRGGWKAFMPTGRSLILAAPPHGLFPVGNILAIFALPRFGGFYVRGAAASAVLNYPIAGHLLRLIGLIDVSRDVVENALNVGEVVGISSGGIAEIFETNSDEGTETIILKSRGRLSSAIYIHIHTLIVP